MTESDTWDERGEWDPWETNLPYLVIAVIVLLPTMATAAYEVMVGVVGTVVVMGFETLAILMIMMQMTIVIGILLYIALLSDRDVNTRF